MRLMAKHSIIPVVRVGVNTGEVNPRNLMVADEVDSILCGEASGV